MSEIVTAEFITVQTDRDERAFFIAAAMTCGFELSKNTPGISNVYTKDKPYERGQMGDIRMMLQPKTKDGLSLVALVNVWHDGKEEMSLARGLPKRIVDADSERAKVELIGGEGDWPGIDSVIIGCAIHYMRAFTLKRVKLPNNGPATEEELNALRILNDASETVTKPAMKSKDYRKRVAQEITDAWKPAMIGWIKAFCANYLVVREICKHGAGTEAIKITRGDRMPLILPKGPNFLKMLKKWT